MGTEHAARILTLVDPRTGRARGELSAARSMEVGSMMKASRKAFPAWRNLTPAERCQRLCKLADSIEESITEYVEAYSRPMKLR